MYFCYGEFPKKNSNLWEMINRTYYKYVIQFAAIQRINVVEFCIDSANIKQT